jgi:hypothetical protein
VITTGKDPYFDCSLPLTPAPSSAVFIALDGAWIQPDQVSRIARIIVRYDDGTSTEKIILTNRDAWSYSRKPEEGIPEDRILWKDGKGHKITVVSVELEPRKTPRSLEIVTMPAIGIGRRMPAIAVFAASQQSAEER